MQQVAIKQLLLKGDTMSEKELDEFMVRRFWRNFQTKTLIFGALFVVIVVVVVVCVCV